ncbi:MAG: hypothetical protein JW912_06900 [Sedimentisphaerales bacterium]|nr:hypothetical protein [Sedimentisphaerales bacterium]
MFNKKAPFHIVFLSTLLVCSLTLYAIDTEMIDEVYQKSLEGQLLDSDDNQIINDFWAEAIEELLLAEDPKEIFRIKTLILAKKPEVNANDYYNGFTQSAKKSLNFAFNEIKNWDNSEHKKNINMNLFILAAQIDSPELVDFAFERIDSQDTVIRYWAVKAITSPAIAGRINSEIMPDEVLAEKVINALEKVVEEEKSSAINEQIVKFLGQLISPQSIQLLLDIAEKRIESYESWNVSRELMDGKLLVAIGTEILTETRKEQRTEMVRSFAQLYSYVIQRYIIGKDFLSETQQNDLVSVMVEVEQEILGKLLEKPQVSIKRAIEKKSLNTLKREHDMLLGTASLTGELARKIDYDYGKNSTGRAINAPKTLPDPEAIE